MLFNWLVVAGYGVLIFLCVSLLLRVVLGKVEKGFSQINERLDKMGKDSSKGDQGKAPNTGSNTQKQRDNKATATGKPVDPNRPHVDK